MDTKHPTDPATGGDEKNQSIANPRSVNPPALKRQRAVASTDNHEEDAPRALHTNDVVTPMLNSKPIATAILEALEDVDEVSVNRLAVSTGNIACTGGGNINTNCSMLCHGASAIGGLAISANIEQNVVLTHRIRNYGWQFDNYPQGNDTTTVQDDATRIATTPGVSHVHVHATTHVETTTPVAYFTTGSKRYIMGNDAFWVQPSDAVPQSLYLSPNRLQIADDSQVITKSAALDGDNLYVSSDNHSNRTHIYSTHINMTGGITCAGPINSGEITCAGLISNGLQAQGGQIVTTAGMTCAGLDCTGNAYVGGSLTAGPIISNGLNAQGGQIVTTAGVTCCGLDGGGGHIFTKTGWDNPHHWTPHGLYSYDGWTGRSGVV